MVTTLCKVIKQTARSPPIETCDTTACLMNFVVAFVLRLLNLGVVLLGNNIKVLSKDADAIAVLMKRQSSWKQQ